MHLPHHPAYGSVPRRFLVIHPRKMVGCRFQLSERETSLSPTIKFRSIVQRGASSEHLIERTLSVTFILQSSTKFSPSLVVSLLFISPARYPKYYDLCWLLTINLISTMLLTPFPHVRETSRGKINNLRPVPATFTFRCLRNLWISICLAISSHRLCLMWFVFLGAWLCL